MISFKNKNCVGSSLQHNGGMYDFDICTGMAKKGCRSVRLTTSPPSLSRLCKENVGALTSHNPMGLTACYRDSTGMAICKTCSCKVNFRTRSVFAKIPKKTELAGGRILGSLLTSSQQTNIQMSAAIVLWLYYVLVFKLCGSVFNDSVKYIYFSWLFTLF
jgi:hypothetical protein